MSFGYKYEQLKPIGDKGMRVVRVRFDPHNPDHQEPYYKEMPYFFNLMDSTHGLPSSHYSLDTFKEVISAGILDLEFTIAAEEVAGPIMTLAYTTSARDFGIEWDRHNNMHIFADHHGEDMGVHKERGRLFRDRTGITGSRCLPHY